MHIVVTILLALLVLLCWAGVLGMWRMREPMQALHYLSLPASIGGIVLTVAVFLAKGPDQVAFKTAFIALVLLGFNSVVTHATARAFRLRAVCTGDTADPDALQYDNTTGAGRTV